jgi:DNA-binding MarR family transcriptional regulator
MRAKGPPSEGGFLVAKAHQIGGRVFARVLKEEALGSINPAQGRILFALWKRGSMTASELARETALDASTMTSMLDRLEAAGLVRRSASIEDRRVVLVERGEADQGLETAYAAASARMTGLFYKGMDAREVKAFEAALRRVVSNLEEAEKALGK